MKKRISQRDIAKILGINVSTVSRALKGLKGVSPSLQRQILDLANEQGYRPNPFAMSLRYDTTHTIGIVVPDVSFSYYAHILKAIESEALPEPPDAIVAAHGVLAISAFQAILSRGLRIPEDVAFIGFMSDWVSEISHPRMTFVKQNLKEIAKKAFKLLYEQMNGEENVCQIVANAHLELRDSTKN